ncbi:MAG: membrane protein insertase YidC [Ruminococcaceae bacterium]|jgi:YidC/Oxa1 family membrane protein insertase|nr:membrane protein insertase YidC [Oscillospiraceae bacterium]
MSLWDYIAKPFGWLLLTLNNLVGNYGVAVFLFALVVKLILLPFQMKSKKSMMRMSALQPQIAELQKRHEGNPRKLQEETSKLYKEEHVNPMSGCLWSLIPFPILLALYRAIRFPLTTMMGVSSDLLAEGGALATKLADMGFSSTANAAYIQLQQSQFISNHWADFDFTTISEKIQFINYKFLGLNLGDMPKLKFWENGLTWAAIGLFLIPIISAALSYLQMHISQKTTPTAGGAEQTQQQMKTMNLMMPLVSLYICFIMPAALGIYWIFTSLLGIIQDVILNKVYGKQMELEKAAREERQRAREAEFERKRQETERLRAEGKTQENTNTSKKKQQARQRAEMDELRAAAVREEKAAKRAAQGIEEEKIPDSQVGSRRYARGRAYVADRFTNPAGAEEATAAAAEESAAWSAEHPVEEAPETVTEPAAEESAAEVQNAFDAAPEETEEVEADEEAEEPEDVEDYDDADEAEDADEPDDEDDERG